MEKCTSTGDSIFVEGRASLDMEDCRVFGYEYGYGVFCQGDLKQTRCTVDDNFIGVRPSPESRALPSWWTA